MSRAKANRALPSDHTSHSKHPFPTAEENTLHMDITIALLESPELWTLKPTAS